MPNLGVGVVLTNPREMNDFGLSSGDILLKINGKSILDTGCIEDPVFGSLPISHEISMFMLQKRICIEVLRSGIVKNIYIPLKHKEDTQRLVPKDFLTMPLEYKIYCGIVVSPLTERLMNHPSCTQLNTLYKYAKRSYVGEEVVVMVEILPGALTKGDESLRFEAIDSINGEKVLNFQDFCKKVDKLELNVSVKFGLYSGKDLIFLSDIDNHKNMLADNAIEKECALRKTPERAASASSIAPRPSLILSKGKEDSRKRTSTASPY
jgi:hypothetical protein